MRDPAVPTRSVRVLRRSALWFSEGDELKRAARRQRSCVECHRALPSRRTPYCGRTCQWRFQGRYFWDAARTYVLHRDRFTCQQCRSRRRVRELEVDHIVEIALGGPSLAYENLQTLCRPCHRSKTVAFLRTRGRAIERDPAEETAEWFPA